MGEREKRRELRRRRGRKSRGIFSPGDLPGCEEGGSFPKTNHVRVGFEQLRLALRL